ncbi:heme ABC transporter ATP-binding protein [Bordetella avium]|uniref:Hemin import ATP-binding protein HmuV n=2 Tax=Bordetella avium TaxID=521 RepID=HMUV_BORA1|nr:heme ABC transporter ATP-binding protein [Bordetella avium]Q2KUC0.1 RecName: Full=Hemin import ATP-binding protein HmuV [Bordetella avium 197N]Q8L1U3.1 RecName: Full=Hemin import ATP-binding protein HmuV [Bordetella avium]AAM28272.1 BhuV [Bordetella avium]AZY50463.1 hemin import ATP-binding protein HmuV [Bordetella avium]AZY53860.1 hemin import ATP-binding protein HmuV [Bordetella avium]RIQ15367.1 heme ABC transporter ATP-binding protein [Bordetella avium]RIQ19828.1 heme ABC transporter A
MTLQAQDLSVDRGAKRILTQVSLTLEPGRMLGLLGANGAGKSTLLACLSGELEPVCGHIEINGKPLRSLASAKQARLRAVLPQKPSLSFDLGVREVVGMGAYPYAELSPADVDALCEKALRQAGVSHLAGRRYLELSGGEQQRVQFARVLMQCQAAPAGQPRYLMLDEPISNLDPRHQIDVLRTAHDLAREAGVGVLVIVHDVNLSARWCDRLLLLAQGSVVADGAPAEVLTPANLRRVYGVEADVLPHPREAGTLLVLMR